MTWLLDGNVLVALVLDTHSLHLRARRWFETLSDPFATCAVTEGTLVRVHMKMAVNQSAAAAWAVLETIHRMPEHVFWEDAFSYAEVPYLPIKGSAQVTDSWLAELARRRRGKLATLDSALATVHADVAVLIPE